MDTYTDLVKRDVEINRLRTLNNILMQDLVKAEGKIDQLKGELHDAKNDLFAARISKIPKKGEVVKYDLPVLKGKVICKI